MFRWGCSDPARIGYTPMTKNGTSRPEKPRNGVLPEDGVKKRYKAKLTNQRRERGSNVKVYSRVLLCGAEPWRYTVFWRLPIILNIAAREHPRAGSKQMATYQAVVAQTQSSSSSSNLCCSVTTQTWSAHHVACSFLHTIHYASSMNAVWRTPIQPRR